MKGHSRHAGAASETRRHTARYAEKRQTILAAAACLFNEKGVRGATLAEVAESVGLTATSVTYYYKKKEDLAAACFLSAITTWDRLLARAAKAPTPGERISDCVRLYFALLRDIALRQHAPLIVFDDIRTLTPPRTDAVFDAYTDMFRRVRALLSGNGGPSLDRAQLNARAHLLLSLLLWVPAWIHRYEPEDYGLVAARVADLIERGFAAPGAAWTLVPEGVSPLAEVNAATRGAFLRAATELVNERGYRGASVDKISARLKLTKGSFYHHHDNKDALIVACFERTFDVVRCAQNAAATRGDTGRVRLCAAASMLVRHQMSGQGPLLRTSALHALPQRARHDMLARMNRLSDRFASFIVDGIADRSIRAVDPSITGQLVNAMINAAAELDRWVPGISAETAADVYVKPLFAGILSGAKPAVKRA